MKEPVYWQTAYARFSRLSSSLSLSLTVPISFLPSLRLFFPPLWPIFLSRVLCSVAPPSHSLSLSLSLSLFVSVSLASAVSAAVPILSVDSNRAVSHQFPPLSLSLAQAGERIRARQAPEEKEKERKRGREREREGQSGREGER